VEPRLEHICIPICGGYQGPLKIPKAPHKVDEELSGHVKLTGFGLTRLKGAAFTIDCMVETTPRAMKRMKNELGSDDKEQLGVAIHAGLGRIEPRAVAWAMNPFDAHTSPRLCYGANTNTKVWLGTARTPGQLVLFCSAMLVSRVAGIPWYSTVNAPVR
jgi:hypothetical protein